MLTFISLEIKNKIICIFSPRKYPPLFLHLTHLTSLIVTKLSTICFMALKVLTKSTLREATTTTEEASSALLARTTTPFEQTTAPTEWMTAPLERMTTPEEWSSAPTEWMTATNELIFPKRDRAGDICLTALFSQGSEYVLKFGFYFPSADLLPLPGKYCFKSS